MSFLPLSINHSLATSSTRTYQICTRCVMDTSDPEIQFDSEGRCNHCTHCLSRIAKEIKTGEEGAAHLEGLVSRIRAHGRGKEYDCITGVSGGVDSTSVLLALKQLGLRPLAVHFDNGWNSELAVQNIRVALEKLQIPLQTHVVDWEEFRDLQLSFIRASVPNWEIPTDHAIHALLIRTALRTGIKYVIGGGNVATEGIMPIAWTYFSPDFRHIKAIHKRFGSGRLRTYPSLPERTFLYAVLIKKVRVIPILNYLNYNKAQAVSKLAAELGWRPYAAKHFESVFTRFYQGYVLPKKFGFDKRRPHYSSLIMAGEITRDEALKALDASPYAGHNIESEQEYILKKLKLSQAEFAQIMAAEPRSHLDYPSNAWMFLGLKQHRDRFKRFATEVPA
jgi:N-acetyl sugar amidotransferase